MVYRYVDLPQIRHCIYYTTPENYSQFEKEANLRKAKVITALFKIEKNSQTC